MALRSIKLTKSSKSQNSTGSTTLNSVNAPVSILMAPQQAQPEVLHPDFQLLNIVPQIYQLPELIPDLIEMVKDGSIVSALERANPKDPRSIIFNGEDQDQFRIEEGLEKDLIRRETGKKPTDIICWNKKCKKQTVYIDEIQTRSLDEGATAFYICSSCGQTKPA